MKLVQALKAVKANLGKIEDLTQKIAKNSAHLSIETPEYKDTTAQINEWLQSIHDTTKENVRLLLAIQKTNHATNVAIKMTNGNMVEKSIAEWVLRRREYSKYDLAAYQGLTDRNLRDQKIKSTSGGPDTEVKVVRNFDPRKRDEKILEFKSEPQLIDAALEVASAITDLLE